MRQRSGTGSRYGDAVLAPVRGPHDTHQDGGGMAGRSAANLKKARSKRAAGFARTQPRAASGSITVRVTERIRDAIQDGEYQLGEALSELKLAAALGVSRTPVREALSALQSQGLIDIRPQSGSFVFMPSEENVGELCEFRRIMEVTALRFCFARRPDESLRAMREAGEAMERAQEAGDRLAIARADTAFHQCIAENSANEYLIDAYKLISGRVAALRTYNLTGTDALRNKAMTEHRAIIAAFARGDLDRAEAILDEHVSRMRIDYRAARRRQAAAEDYRMPARRRLRGGAGACPADAHPAG
jgi:DNA-binding GntR family transcriptional regulator